MWLNINDCIYWKRRVCSSVYSYQQQFWTWTFLSHNKRDYLKFPRKAFFLWQILWPDWPTACVMSCKTFGGLVGDKGCLECSKRGWGFIRVSWNFILFKWLFLKHSVGVVVICISKMVSSNENIFQVTGPLWGEFTDQRGITLTRSVAWTFDFFIDVHLIKRLSKQ